MNARGGGAAGFVEPAYHHRSLGDVVPAVASALGASLGDDSLPTGLHLPDAQIAAVCLEYDLILVTYNLKDFQFIADLNVTTPPFPTI